MLRNILIFSVLILTIGTSVGDDIDVIYERRVKNIISSNYNPEAALRWRNELTSNGNWTDVDYTTGCDARRADWPAQDHFHRIMTMASSWSETPSDINYLTAISSALDYWFDRDFKEDDCINAGGNSGLNCPCGTPGFWNTNWYDQMILIPGLVGNACLILKSNLTSTQFSNCTTQTSRAYVRINGDPNGSMGPQTGANYLDVSSIGVSLALIASDLQLLDESVGGFYKECQLTMGDTDGIKVDGSFMQHSNQLYTGNYGQVFMRNMLKIFMETSNTSIVPPESVQSAFLTVISGSEWFMYLKNGAEEDPLSPLLLWQFSAIGRMVSHKYEDWHGTGLSLNEIIESTKDWPNQSDFQAIVNRLRNQDSVNPGGLVGTRFFHTSDYMVHRSQNYIVTLKMFSSRTSNSECNNGQNPYGFHLSDGVIYTYLHGNEYTNVYGAWDWNLIPGSTIDYGVTPLACNAVQFKGIEPFVGGVTLGNSGIAVMNYTNPSTKSLHWLKTYFFLPGSYVVQFVGTPISTANNSAPIYTTLDQRQLSGPVYIDGELVENKGIVTKPARSVWHDRVGYLFTSLLPIELTVDITDKSANWSQIGISEGNETQSIFSAYFAHPPQEIDDMRFSYITLLDIDLQDFINWGKKSRGFGLIDNYSDRVPTTSAMAVVRGTFYGYDEPNGNRTVSLAFLTAGEYNTNLEDITKVESDNPILLIFEKSLTSEDWKLAVSDPSQSLISVKITVYISLIRLDLNVELPTGPYQGSKVVIEL